MVKIHPLYELQNPYVFTSRYAKSALWVIRDMTKPNTEFMHATHHDRFKLIFHRKVFPSIIRNTQELEYFQVLQTRVLNDLL